MMMICSGINICVNAQGKIKQLLPLMMTFHRQFNTPSKNFDLEYLRNMEHDKLVYR